MRQADARIVYGFTAQTPIDLEAWLDANYPTLTRFDHGTDSALTSVVGVQVAALEGINCYDPPPVAVQAITGHPEQWKVWDAQRAMKEAGIECGDIDLWLIGSMI